MGKRGPKPKLAVVRELEGNPGKRPMPHPGMEVDGEPFIPDFIGEDAQACVELIKSIMPPKVYAGVDGFALSAYATNWAWFKYMAHAMQHPDFKPLVKGSVPGTERPHPYFKMIDNIQKLMMSWGDRLGLDPKARQALNNQGEPEAPVNKFQGLMSGRGAG